MLVAKRHSLTVSEKAVSYIQNAVCVAVLALSLSALAAPSLSAQDESAELKSLRSRLNVLEERVFGFSDQNGNPQLPGRAQTSAGAPANAQQALLADMAAQIGSLERQLRELTGRLEEAEFHNRQLSDQLTSLSDQVTAMRSAALSGSQVPASSTASASPKPQPTASALPDGAEALSEPAANSGVVALPTGTATERYNYAFGFIRSGDLDSGRLAMEQFLAEHSGDELEPNALFWLGRIHLRQQQYGQAARQLLTLIDKYEGSDKTPEALLDLSEALIGLDSKPDACNALAEFNTHRSEASKRLADRASRLRSQAGCR